MKFNQLKKFPVGFALICLVGFFCIKLTPAINDKLLETNLLLRKERIEEMTDSDLDWEIDHEANDSQLLNSVPHVRSFEYYGFLALSVGIMILSVAILKCQYQSKKCK